MLGGMEFTCLLHISLVFLLLLPWYLLGPRPLYGHIKIPSPSKSEVIDILAALICQFWLYYPSPLVLFLVFTILRRRLPLQFTLARPSPSTSDSSRSTKLVSSGARRSKPLHTPPLTTVWSNDNITFGSLGSPFQSAWRAPSQVNSMPIKPALSTMLQLPLKDASQLLRELIRNPIILPSIDSLRPAYQPISVPFALPKQAGTKSLHCSTAGPVESAPASGEILPSPLHPSKETRLVDLVPREPSVKRKRIEVEPAGGLPKSKAVKALSSTEAREALDVLYAEDLTKRRKLDDSLQAVSGSVFSRS
ncbi:hypothetical protein BDU57DRAFT_543601 [Ampelomyces quisqualis]|uniref:Uncharacterized protein n=1 Tax=Ampelomyces quisqualis TaxID=50730 RepID=A0A6A5Q5K2_AMPQU|nr:hypothetical protein BDU57DRAFT_543601 [Ampelomyces quisqualis]